MAINAFGIIAPAGGQIQVKGLQDYRPISSFSFLGRYRIIDFPLSSLSNSNIERIQVYASQNPRSLAEHLGSGRIYNINSKRGKLQLLFNQDSTVNNIYNTDILAYTENLSIIERMHQPYVIITPGYMIFKQDYGKLLEDHIQSGADITLLYHRVSNAKESFRNCATVNLNRQKGVVSIEPNAGNASDKNIFMDTYIMKRELFVELIRLANKVSSVFRLVDVINMENKELDIRGHSHKGFFAAVTDFKSYFDANMQLLDFKLASELITDEWPIYTRTTDACPVKYTGCSSVKNSMVANGCVIEGTVENSIIGRGVVIKKGAFIKDCVIMGHTVIDKDVHLENQVVDKWAKIKNVKEIISTPDQPGYVKREDVL
ncbi:MAG: glucose-1-phosphate adenylyltransferase subunit GlgD [Butyrivibrio sp.]|nr:glucose-1-phosphate adenylyltransferase subunit GlgD [Butyrivibrio sp.]